MPHLPRPEATLEDKPEDSPRRRRRRRRRRTTTMPATPMSDEPPEEMAPPPVVGALPVTPAAEPTHEGTRGMLTVHTTPWSTVRVAGRIVGNTPRTNLIVPAGTVLVEVQREGHGPWETFRVQVSPGETATFTHSF